MYKFNDIVSGVKKEYYVVYILCDEVGEDVSLMT